MQKLFNNIRLWGILLFLALALIIFLPALMEYHSTKQDLVQLWQEQSRLVAETIVRGGQTMLRFDEQRLLEQKSQLISDGLTLRQLDSLNYPDLRLAMEFARQRLHANLLYFSESGQLIHPPTKGSRHLIRSNRMLQQFQELLQQMPADSLVHLILPSPLKKPQPPALVIRRANQRGFMMALIRPAMGERMMRFRGFKRWLNELIKAPDILFIQLLKGARVVVQAGDIHLAPETPPQEFTPGRPNWQIHKIKDQTIFDYWQPAPDGNIIRIGLATQALDHLQKNLIQRLLLNSLLLLIIGFLVLRFILNRQNVALLQNRLQQLETYTGSLLRNMSDGILAFNSAQQIEFSNPAFSTLTNVRDLHSLKESIAFLPEEIQQKLIAFQEFENFSYSYNNRFLLLSGKRVELQGADQTPNLLYMLIVRDFTSQKELDEMKTRRNKLLAMGELASRVAHEIRNPLNGIAMLAQRLQKEFTPTENAEEFQQMTSAIRQETERLNQIVHSFLFYARTPQVKFKTTSLAQFLTGVKPVLEACGNSLLHIKIENDALVKLDHDQFKQALINLVKNAMEASPPEFPVEIRLETNHNNAVLFVEDQGRGIAEEIKDRIFDLYFTTRNDGNGIGLSIVEKIIEAHGGQIKVESPYTKDGQMVQGTRFIIKLPKEKKEDNNV